jgi:hypothetical protein
MDEWGCWSKRGKRFPPTRIFSHACARPGPPAPRGMNVERFLTVPRLNVEKDSHRPGGFGGPGLAQAITLKQRWEFLVAQAIDVEGE